MVEKPIRGIVFDLDGLLVDSEPVQFAAWDLYLSRFGCRVTPELATQMYGRRLQDAAEAVVDHLELPVTVDSVARDRDAIFLKMAAGRITAKPGARDLVEWCCRFGIAVALATSGHREYVELALSSAGLKELFKVQVTGELVRRGKPAPDTFLLAANAIGIDPEECLVLEDSPNGVRAALSAGMRCIAIPDQAEVKDQYFGATVVLNSLNEVEPFLRRQPWFQEKASHG